MRAILAVLVCCGLACAAPVPPAVLTDTQLHHRWVIEWGAARGGIQFDPDGRAWVRWHTDDGCDPGPIYPTRYKREGNTVLVADALGDFHAVTLTRDGNALAGTWGRCAVRIHSPRARD